MSLTSIAPGEGGTGKGERKGGMSQGNKGGRNEENVIKDVHKRKG